MFLGRHSQLFRRLQLRVPCLPVSMRGLASSVSGEGPMYKRIIEKVQTQIDDISYITLQDESHMHSRGLETHFKLIVVSDTFNGKPLVARHRELNKILAEELQTGGVHALSLLPYTKKQWDELRKVPTSPTCQGHPK